MTTPHPRIPQQGYRPRAPMQPVINGSAGKLSPLMPKMKRKLEYPPMMPMGMHGMISPKQRLIPSSSERALLDLDLNRVVTVQRVENPNVQPFHPTQVPQSFDVRHRLPPMNTMTMKVSCKWKTVACFLIKKFSWNNIITERNSHATSAGSSLTCYYVT